MAYGRAALAADLGVRPTTVMRRLSLRLTIVWLGFALAWLVPVHKEGITLPDGLPGWQAFRIAAAPVWPYEGTRYDTWWSATLSTLSAATNLLMLGSFLVALRLPSFLRTVTISTFVAFLVNAQWLLLNTEWVDLRAGYYLWWLSFLGVSVASYKEAVRASERSSHDAAA